MLAVLESTCAEWRRAMASAEHMSSLGLRSRWAAPDLHLRCVHAGLRREAELQHPAPVPISNPPPPPSRPQEPGRVPSLPQAAGA